MILKKLYDFGEWRQISESEKNIVYTHMSIFVTYIRYKRLNICIVYKH